MKCDSKSMIKIAVGLITALAIMYVAWPAARAFIVASAPILLALSCPLAMVLMMKGMNSSKHDDSARLDEGKLKSKVGGAEPSESPSAWQLEADIQRAAD